MSKGETYVAPVQAEGGYASRGRIALPSETRIDTTRWRLATRVATTQGAALSPWLLRLLTGPGDGEHRLGGLAQRNYTLV